MKYVKLGKSELNVSRICMGCMGFGDPLKGHHNWTLDEEKSRDIIKHGLDAGINFYDTAIAYQGGTSEQFVGRALQDFALRDDFVIATKFLPRSVEEIKSGVNGKKHVETSLNQSLKNLGMDYVDLYIYHMWDYQTLMEEIMEGLDSVVKSGKARYIGISNCYPSQLEKANSYARQNGFPEFISVQGHYNLIAREEERAMTSFCYVHDIAMTPYSALASGRLSRHSGEISRRLREDSIAKMKYDRTAESDGKIIVRVEELASKYNVSMTEISLSWLLTKVTSPVVGATKGSHIDTAVKALDLSLSEDDINYLEELYVPHELVGVMALNGKQNGGSVV